MNELQLFNFNGSNIRTLLIEDEPYFVGKDVAEVLGYSNHRKALGDHVDAEDKKDGVTIRDSIGRTQKPVIINESGMYSLVLSSKLPQAKEFKRWVTKEVLPAIRKNGTYSKNSNFEQFAGLPLDKQLLQIAGAQSQRLDEVEHRMNVFEENQRVDSDQQGSIQKAVSVKVHEVIRTHNWSCKDKAIKGKLFSNINGDINAAFGVNKRGMLKAKDYDEIMDFINVWNPSSVTVLQNKKRMEQLELGI